MFLKRILNYNGKKREVKMRGSRAKEKGTKGTKIFVIVLIPADEGTSYSNIAKLSFVVLFSAGITISYTSFILALCTNDKSNVACPVNDPSDIDLLLAPL